MKAFWISALLLMTCASAVTGISKSEVAGAPAAERERLISVRGTADQGVLVSSARRGL